jgi:hypothetical protein
MAIHLLVVRPATLYEGVVVVLVVLVQPGVQQLPRVARNHQPHRGKLRPEVITCRSSKFTLDHIS